MSILFDNLRFQNKTHEGGREPIVAEIGVIVNNLPSECASDDDDFDFVTLPVKVSPGYYYVAMISKIISIDGMGTEEWGKRYVVSKESIYEYIYDFADVLDPPKYIECYDRIDDAADSDFLSFFLLMNRLIDESRDDRARINNARRMTRLQSDIQTTIQIEKVDKFSIISKATICEKPFRELRCEIVLDEERGRGSAINFNDKLYIKPMCFYIECDEKNTLEEHFTLDRAYESKYFTDYVRLEKSTTARLLSYFEQEKDTLERRFTEEEIAALKTGILGVALGLKEYLK